ncbi:MAG: hypothetical protein V4726_23465, partial [Verrucomicrobiota bacterium]
MNRMRLLLPLLACFLCAPAARAQYELKAWNSNRLWFSPGRPAAGNEVALPSTADSNFRSAGQISGSSGPRATGTPSNTAKTLLLKRSTIGGTFSSGVPRYSMGDEMTPPLVKADGFTLLTPNELPGGAAPYWSTRPVLPGDTGAGSTALTTVSVTKAATDSTSITVASVPAALVPGATLLGQAVAGITGTTVTLAGKPNTAITAATAVPIYPAVSFYYSPHAEKVFASQPGRVVITWITRLAESGSFPTRTEEFAVSSSTGRPVRTIYWTEGSFDGPRVQITDGRIQSVNPIFNPNVPKAVAQEVNIPGYTPVTPNVSTLSFDRYNGVGQLHAYNVEGRILVEFLGNVRVAPNVYDFVGFDVVDLVRVPDINYPTVHLGSEIRPHDGDGLLKAQPLLSGQQNAASYYGSSLRPDGSFAYYAERETGPVNTPDNGSPATEDAFNKVAFYWMETGAYNIQWPKFQDRYWLRWSPNLSDYAHYTVDSGGGTAQTGIAFTGGSLPEIVYPKVWNEKSGQKPKTLI